MEYKDLHPFFKSFYWVTRQEFTVEESKNLERRYGPLKKGELPWSCYVSVLSGVAFVVCIAAFNLWAYFAGLFITAMILIWFIPSKNKRAND